MDSLSSLSKDIVVFLQFENACIVRLDICPLTEIHDNI